MVSYQCLRCRAVATAQAGCPACGAAPDPLAIELAEAAQTRAGLDRREAELRQEHASILWQRNQLDQRAAQLWTEISRRDAGHPGAAAPLRAATLGAGRPGVGPQPGAAIEFGVGGQPGAAPQQAAPQPPGQLANSRPETSTRSTQNILLLLGGLLLGVAAIVFAAVAWTTFGMVGRAAILATTTVVALAAPVLLRRRELRATAETIACIALLLTALDGYAAWTVNLAGAQQLSPRVFTALVFAAVVAASLGYQAVSRLAAPWAVALAAAQPVLPLLVTDAGPLGYAVAFTAVAAGNLAAALVWRRVGPEPAALRTALRAAAMTMGAIAGVSAGVLTLWELVWADTGSDASRAGAVLLVLAALPVTGALLHRRRIPIVITAGLAAPAAVLALSRPVAIGFPGYGLLTAALVTAVIMAAAGAAAGKFGRREPAAAPVAASAAQGPAGEGVGRRRLPAVTGLWAGASATAALLAVPAGLAAAIGAVRILQATSPIWHADLARLSETAARLPYDWQPTAVLLVLSAAALAAGPARITMNRQLGIVGAGAAAIGASSTAAHAWWLPIPIVVALGLGLFAATALLPTLTRRAGSVAELVCHGGVAAVLLGYGLALSLARPGATAVVLSAIAVVCAGVAAAGHRADTRAARATRGVGAAVAIAALPGIAAAATASWGFGSAVAAPATMGATALGLLVAAALRRHGPAEQLGSPLTPYAVIGVALSAAISTFCVLASDQRAGLYAAVAGVIGIGNGMLVLPRRTQAMIRVAVSATIPLSVAAVTAAAAALAPFQAFLWLSEPWQADPADDTTRELLAPTPTWQIDGWDVATLALLTLAATLGVLGLGGLRRATSTAALGAVLTLLATPVGFHLPWPALPLIGLGIAVVAGLTAALLPPDRWGGLPWACRVVWPIAGAVGLASCLATSTATLVGLGVATAAGFVAAAAGRGAAGRQTGWVVTGASAALLAHSAGVEAQLGPELAPYLVLGVAVMLLAASAGLPAVRRGSESRVVEWLSYGSAGFAALLGAAAPATTAAVLAGYGALLGLSGLRPGRLRLVIGAAGCELLAWWIFLFQQSVGLAEAYTLPLALAALVGGVIEMRRRPQLSSWRGYGVALAAGFLPSMTVVASGDAEPVRRLALGVAALAVLLIGVARRRQAPVAFGGAVLALVALWELAQLWELVPRWLPLALAGLLLVALGATYEQRRRDLRRLRQAMARMR